MCVCTEKKIRNISDTLKRAISILVNWLGQLDLSSLVKIHSWNVSIYKDTNDALNRVAYVAECFSATEAKKRSTDVGSTHAARVCLHAWADSRKVTTYHRVSSDPLRVKQTTHRGTTFWILLNQTKFGLILNNMAPRSYQLVLHYDDKHMNKPGSDHISSRVTWPTACQIDHRGNLKP